MKEEALDRTLWRTRFERGYGFVIRQTIEYMKEWMNEWMKLMDGINEWMQLGRQKKNPELQHTGAW